MLYIAYRHYFEKKGLPVFIARTYTEQFDEKHPMQPVYSRDWLFYNRHRDGIPAPGDLRLPPRLLLVCKGVRRFLPDFFSDEPMNWIVSGRFLHFLQQRRLMEGQYEQSELKLVSTTGKPITDQPYFLLRLSVSADALIDFDHSPPVPSRHKPIIKTMPRRLYYTDLVFREGITPPPLFALDASNYWYVFLCSESIKQAMEQEGFLGFDFYTLTEYIQETEHRGERPTQAAYKNARIVA